MLHLQYKLPFLRRVIKMLSSIIMKWNTNSHEGAYKRFALSITGGNNTHSIGGPLEIIDAAGEHPELVLENEFVAGAPDADDAGAVARGDPLAVGRVAGDGDIVGVLGVNGNLEGAIKVPDNDGSAVAVKDGIWFRIAGDQDSPAPLRRRHASVRLL